MKARSPILVSFFRVPSKFAVIAPAPMFTSRPTVALPEVGEVAGDRARSRCASG